METFGRRDNYNVVKSIRFSNVTIQGMDCICIIYHIYQYHYLYDMFHSFSLCVIKMHLPDLLNVNVNVYSKVTVAMEGRLELEVVTSFEGLRSGEKYTKVARFALDASGRFQDL